LIALSVEDTIHACHMIAVHMVNPLSILRLASPAGLSDVAVPHLA
jgi:hypothetical protein